MPSLQRDEAVGIAVLVVASAVLAVQFLAPPSVVLSFGETTTTTPGRDFALRDAAVIAAAAAAAGASATYLLVGGADPSGTTSPSESPSTSTPRSSGAASDASSTAAPDRDDGPEPTEDLLEARRREWSERSERLAGNERAVYETVLDADGVLPQSDIVDRTDLSKATVSRALDSLEAKDLVERKRRGMGNVVLLR